MDPYVKAYLRTHVHVDAGQRVWCKGVEVPVHVIGGVKKVTFEELGKLTYSFDQLHRAGVQVDVVTIKRLADYGAEGRWKEQREARRESGLPSNVYVANARSVQYALDKGKLPPPLKYVGRMRDKITEVYDTVDEVVNAIRDRLWRTEFSRGRYAKRHKR